jgi:hypothetical protein
MYSVFSCAYSGKVGAQGEYRKLRGIGWLTRAEDAPGPST